MRAEHGRPLAQRYGLLSGVDRVRIFLAGLGVAAQTEDPVLGLQDYLDAVREVGRGDQRHADAEVDVHSVFEFLGGALDDAFAASGGVPGSCLVSEGC